jgi:hypothetical protein
MPLWQRAVLIGLPALLVVLGGLTVANAATNNAPPPDEVDCTLVVPANPLTARGLATPYTLRHGCHQSDGGSTTFVEATVVDPATGKLSVYAPLVIDEGTKPAVAPVVPALPRGAVVGIWFGFNGDNLTLAGDVTGGRCVNGLRGSIFGQFAFCNAPRFFAAANDAIAAGSLVIPKSGTASDGQPCPTTRDFGIVDQDQSDNVTSTYLVLGNGRTAQNTAANRAALMPKGAQVEVNGSDNGLLVSFVLPALGCRVFRASNLADPGTTATSLALNELQAAANQTAPIALVPSNDPMTEVNGRISIAKTNLYRAGVNMGPIDTATETPGAYCQQMLTGGIARTELDRKRTVKRQSPDPEAANSLFTFLAARMSGSFDNLSCGNLLHIKNPVVLTVDKQGVAVNAKFVTRGLPAPSPTARPTKSSPPAPSASPTRKPTPTPGSTRTATPTPGSTRTATPTRAPAPTTTAPSYPGYNSGVPTTPGYAYQPAPSTTTPRTGTTTHSPTRTTPPAASVPSVPGQGQMQTLPQPAVSSTDDYTDTPADPTDPVVTDPTDPVVTNPTGIAVQPVGAMRLKPTPAAQKSILASFPLAGNGSIGIGLVLVGVAVLLATVIRNWQRRRRENFEL